MERWDEHVSEWTRWANEGTTEVEFVYWGSHELLDLLVQPRHAGRVRFWFETSSFNDAWFDARMEEARKTVGPRYTPEIHVDLPIAEDFDAFGRTGQLFDSVKKQARTIRSGLRTFGYRDNSTSGETADEATASLIAKVNVILEELACLEYQPVGPLPFSRIAEQVADAEDAAEAVEQLVFDQETAHDEEETPAGDTSGKCPTSSLRICTGAYVLGRTQGTRLDPRPSPARPRGIIGRLHLPRPQLRAGDPRSNRTPNTTLATSRALKRNQQQTGRLRNTPITQYSVTNPTHCRFQARPATYLRQEKRALVRPIRLGVYIGRYSYLLCR